VPVQICLCLCLIGSVDHRQWLGSAKVVASRRSDPGKVTDLDCQAWAAVPSPFVEQALAEQQPVACFHSLWSSLLSCSLVVQASVTEAALAVVTSLETDP
jgi:hypothetical protein